MHWIQRPAPWRKLSVVSLGACDRNKGTVSASQTRWDSYLFCFEPCCNSVSLIFLLSFILTCSLHGVLIFCISFLDVSSLEFLTNLFQQQLSTPWFFFSFFFSTLLWMNVTVHKTLYIFHSIVIFCQNYCMCSIQSIASCVDVFFALFEKLSLP